MPIPKALLFAGCLGLATAAGARSREPIKPVAHVDLPRFMGKWYVIASIPTHYEKNAYDAVETYTLQSNGPVHTSYRYRDGSFDAPVKIVHATGYVQPDCDNAIWGMQFIWPLKAEYVVAYLDDNYRETIIARNKRDYVWVMARTPTIPQADYDAMLDRINQLGYSLADVRKVPQRSVAPANESASTNDGLQRVPVKSM